MLKNTIKIFEDITKIPHCSYETNEMKKFIINFAKKYDFVVKTDKAGNILCQKGKPEICLQAHYDMVCIGSAPNIKTYQEDGWMRAKNSSLGADNGVAIAMMFAFMQTKENLECLFTNDEEVGLLGANELDLDISSSKLLNLDSEEEGSIFIGCAGSVEIDAELELTFRNKSKKETLYEVSIDGLPGGHSGIDIDKDIPNAIKVLAKIILENNCSLVKLEGGERSNSIPKSAKAIIASSSLIVCNDNRVKIENSNLKNALIIVESQKILGLINAFSQGVRSFNKEFNLPNESINLSTVTQNKDKIKLEFYARSLREDGLKTLEDETISLLKGFGFIPKVGLKSSTWFSKSEFAKQVQKAMKKIYKKPEFKLIHAGLECGVIARKQKKDIQICSIGPTIEAPHSIREKFQISSLEKTLEVLKILLK